MVRAMVAKTWKANLSLIARGMAVFLLLALFWLAREVGALMNALLILIWVGAAIVIVRRAVDAFRRRLSADAYGQGDDSHLAFISSRLGSMGKASKRRDRRGHAHRSGAPANWRVRCATCPRATQ
jgi:hypothetical protein